MSITELTKQLQTISKFKGIHYSLDHLYPLLEKLGNPHLRLNKVVHVAGTNGKGSTVQFLNAVCQAHGLTVGIYTSPHLSCYTERLQFNGRSISESDFQHYFDHVFSITEGACSEFECLTLMSFCYFADKQPDIVLFEAGLGGRLDTTNVVSPTLTLITSISFDHEAYLGTTLEQIANEKAGIIKAGVPLITTTTNPIEVQDVFKQKCQKQQSTCFFVSPLKQLPEQSVLVGKHQCINASLAIEAAKQLNIGYDQHKALHGLQQARHWGRYLKLKRQNQTIIIDAAHNEQGMCQLIENLKQDFPNQQPTFLLGLNKNKAVDVMMTHVLSYTNQLYYCEFDDYYALSFQDVSALYPAVNQYHLSDELPRSSLLVITGSIYFIGQFKAIFE